jgi:hypothetical protein
VSEQFCPGGPTAFDHDRDVYVPSPFEVELLNRMHEVVYELRILVAIAAVWSAVIVTAIAVVR